MTPSDSDKGKETPTSSAAPLDPASGKPAMLDAEVAEANKATRMMVAELTASRFSSPFPPPEILEGYERVKRGLADRVVEALTAEAAHRRKLQEDEATHRRKLEERAQSAKEEDMRAARAAERRGQYCAMTVCLFIVGCGTAAALSGYTIAGSVIGSGAALLGVVNAFLSRRTSDPSASDEGSLRSSPPASSPPSPGPSSQK